MKLVIAPAAKEDLREIKEYISVKLCNPTAAVNVVKKIIKDYKMLPYRARTSVKPKDEKRYMVQLSKVVALVALAPLLSALVGLWNMLAALIVLIAATVFFLWLSF